MKQKKDIIIARIKITKYLYEDKVRYLAEIDRGYDKISFNETTKKKLCKEISKEI